MASSKEDIASQALARLGEPSISSFEENSETAEKVNQLYEPVIQNLLGRYQWTFASRRVKLVVDGGKVPANEWKRGFLLPTPRTEMVGNPYRVYNSTGLRAPEVFDYEIEGRYVLTNYDLIVVEYTARLPESQWTGYFEVLAAEALAATLALPITENASKEQWHQQKAFGSPSDMGEGGLFATAKAADDMGSPPRSLLDESDPMWETRFSGSRQNGWW